MSGGHSSLCSASSGQLLEDAAPTLDPHCTMQWGKCRDRVHAGALQLLIRNRAILFARRHGRVILPDEAVQRPALFFIPFNHADSSEDDDSRVYSICIELRWLFNGFAGLLSCL